MKIIFALICFMFVSMYSFAADRVFVVKLDGKVVPNEKFIVMDRTNFNVATFVNILTTASAEHSIKQFEGLARERDSAMAVIKKKPNAKFASDPNVGYARKLKSFKDRFIETLNEKIANINKLVFNRASKDKNVFVVTTDANGKFIAPTALPSQFIIFSYDTEFHKDKKYIVAIMRNQQDGETVIETTTEKNIMLLDSKILDSVMNYK